MPDKSRNSKKKKSRRRASSGNAPKKDENFQWRKATRTLSFWLIIIIVSIFISQRFSIDEKGAAKIGYSRFRDHLENSRIEEAIIADKEFLGKLKSETTDIIGDKQVTYLRFKVILPEVPDDKTAAQWIRDYGVTLRFEEISNDWWNYVFSLLPWILFGVFWIFILRRMQGGGPKGIFSFGKSRAKLITEDEAKVTFDDVAGADEAKQELREIIDFLKDPDKFQKLGGKIPKGALLLGPPGTGKTLLARAVAGEAGVPFFTMSGADFVEMFVGVGASRVRDLFEQGKKNAPCIIFIDEIDAVGRHRGAGLGGGHDEREQTLNQLLVEMDGFESNEGVILIAATNRPDVLDSALLRPGRFDRQIVVDRPDVRGREGILKVHTINIPIAQDVDLSTIAKGTPGFSGADLANLANEAALLAARYNKKVVEMSDFEYAKDKVMMGVERKSLLISEDEKKLTAIHEAGHVLVAKYLPESDAVHKVTIIPRGRAMGTTNYLPGEKHSWSKKYCETVLAQMLGGRAAELVVMKELTTGAGNDIERATALARKMVCEWGMSEKMGPLTFGKKDEEIFIAREIGRHQDHSEKKSELIDTEMKRIVEAAEKKALAILEKHVDKLHAIANALLEREILDGVEIDKVLAGQPLEPIEVKENSKKSGSRKRKEKEVVDDVK